MTVKFAAVVVATALLANAGASQVQKTRKGCTCSGQCGATVDFGAAKYDWCYTEGKCGTYSYTRLKYYDYCQYAEDKSYESQTAEAKQDFLWSRTIAESKQSGDWPNQAGIFAESVKTSFDDLSDVFPGGRTKYIHSVGAVAKVALVADPSSPFSGSFAGSSHGLIRISTAKAISSSSITPGFGLKLLRDGVPSANLVAMPSLDGQSDFNLAKFNYSNHLVKPSSWALKIVAEKFTQASNCPLMVGLTDMASVGADGKPEAKVIAPFHLEFVPTPALRSPSSPYSQDKFLSFLESIDTNATIFEIYASSDPSKDTADIRVGEIKLTGSPFARSKFGDESLFFRHQYMEEDFKAEPSWLSSIDKDLQCGTKNVGPAPPMFLAHENLEAGHLPCPFATGSGMAALRAARDSQPCPFASM